MTPKNEEKGYARATNSTTISVAQLMVLSKAQWWFTPKINERYPLTIKI